MLIIINLNITLVFTTNNNLSAINRTFLGTILCIKPSLFIISLLIVFAIKPLLYKMRLTLNFFPFTRLLSQILINLTIQKFLISIIAITLIISLILSIVSILIEFSRTNTSAGTVNIAFFIYGRIRCISPLLNYDVNLVKLFRTYP